MGGSRGGRGGSRGGSRDGSRGGRGARGGSRGRGGRGRGRGKPVFDSARLAEKEEGSSGDDSEGSATESDADDDELEDVSTDGSDDEEIPTAKPYAALLQSLAVSSQPPAKRRKLDTDNHGVEKGDQENDDEQVDVDDLDRVDEDEEGPETATEGLLEDDEDEAEDPSDPFELHFADPDENILTARLKAIQEKKWTTARPQMSKIGKAIIAIPGEQQLKDVTLPASIAGPASLKLKQKLATSFNEKATTFDTLEQTIAPCLFNHQDLLFCERTPANSERLRRLACLHATNHVFKTRDRVIKNNARLSRDDGNNDLELRDQGFTRPKVLMLLPTRQSCVRMIDTIVSLCEPDQQENRKRFEESFVRKEDPLSEDKPADFRELFEGNDDDMFRLGMKFTRKTIKYFSQFYNSDIIFASPLGLRMAIGSEDSKKVDSDFLSSIEIVIVDQADALLMQNWEHMEFIFEHMNQQPKEAHGCDFSRVRSWYLDNNARYFRQTITFAAFNTPEFNTLFYTKSQNWAGKIKITANYPGALEELGIKVKQIFSRLDTPSVSKEPDTRFTYFTTAIIPTLIRNQKDRGGTLIFVPSYLDFVRVRNYFANSPNTSNISFGSISEYTSPTDVARARSHFLTGRHSVLLYTERAHHFRRYRLNGVRKVVMYGLPDNPTFYKEIVGGYMGQSVQHGDIEPGDGSARVLFSQFDVLKLERVAGTDRVGKMIKEKGDTFEFL
jgi:U3 small nucleolar RNA-associated protein 25